MLSVYGYISHYTPTRYNWEGLQIRQCPCEKQSVKVTTAGLCKEEIAYLTLILVSQQNGHSLFCFVRIKGKSAGSASEHTFTKVFCCSGTVNEQQSRDNGQHLRWSFWFWGVQLYYSFSCLFVVFKARRQSRDTKSSSTIVTSGQSNRHPSGKTDCYQHSPEEMGRSGGRRRRGSGQTSGPVTSKEIKITIGRYCTALRHAHVTVRSIWSH